MWKEYEGRDGRVQYERKWRDERVWGKKRIGYEWLPLMRRLTNGLIERERESSISKRYFILQKDKVLSIDM